MLDHLVHITRRDVEPAGLAAIEVAQNDRTRRTRAQVDVGRFETHRLQELELFALLGKGTQLNPRTIERNLENAWVFAQRALSLKRHVCCQTRVWNGSGVRGGEVSS